MKNTIIGILIQQSVQSRIYFSNGNRANSIKSYYVAPIFSLKFVDSNTYSSNIEARERDTLLLLEP